MFAKILGPHADKAYSALRMVAGLLFSFHGMQKILGWLAEMSMPAVGTQMWFGGMIELVAGLLIFLGLFTRCAAFVASGEMAVAYVQFHWKLRFDSNFFPIVNHGELALLFCFVFLYVACAGGGRCSLDRLFHRHSSPPPP